MASCRQAWWSFQPALSLAHLVFGRVIALGETAIHLPIMQQVIVHQVPAPTLVIAAQQGHVTLALHGRPLRGDADDSHGAQRALPPHLPGMAALAEADLGPCPICALGDGVAVQGEAVLLDVDVPRAVVGAEGVVKGTDLVEEKKGRGEIKSCHVFQAPHTPWLPMVGGTSS